MSELIQTNSKSFLHRFVAGVGQALGLSQAEAVSVKKLEGRVEELRLKAQRVLELLKNIRLEMEVKLDPSLFSHAVSILDPLIREVKRVNSQEQYDSWIQKAKRWEKVVGRTVTRDTMVSALIENTLLDTTDSIERDIKVISVYFRNRLDLTKNTQNSQTLLKQLQNIFKKMRKLPSLFAPATLEELVQHRARVNKMRESYHEKALVLIDKQLPK